MVWLHAHNSGYRDDYFHFTAAGTGVKELAKAAQIVMGELGLKAAALQPRTDVLTVTLAASSAPGQRGSHSSSQACEGKTELTLRGPCGLSHPHFYSGLLNSCVPIVGLVRGGWLLVLEGEEVMGTDLKYKLESMCVKTWLLSPRTGNLVSSGGGAGLTGRAGLCQPVDKPGSALILGAGVLEEGIWALWTPVKNTSVRQVKWKLAGFAGAELGQNIMGSSGCFSTYSSVYRALVTQRAPKGATRWVWKPELPAVWMLWGAGTNYRSHQALGCFWTFLGLFSQTHIPSPFV